MKPFGARLRTLSGRVVLALAVCVVVVGAGVVVVNRYIDDQVDKIPRVAVSTSPVGAHGMNFLIIGSDSRSFVNNETDYKAFSDKDTQNAPPRSDTLMVLHADGDNSFAVSFPRDLWVDIPGKGGAKINAAFNDGPQKVIDTVQSDFNVPINHYLEVDFVSFEGIVNAIGPVPTWIPGVLRDDFTGFSSPYGAGCYPLDGGESLKYVRSRDLQIQDANGKWRPLDGTADIGRIKRQQEFVQKLGRMAVARATDDPLIAPDIIDALVPNLHADTGFDRDALNALVRSLIGLGPGRAGLQFETIPWTDPGRPVGGQSALLLKQPEANAVFERLRGDVVTEPTAPPDTQATAPAQVRPSDVRVRVLNASGVAGAAADADQALGNRGFVTGGIGNWAGVAVNKSQVRYRPGDEPKAQLVAAAVPGADLVADSGLTGDVVLVLGPGFKGVGAAAPKDTAVTTPAAPAVSPEEACKQALSLS